MYINRDIEPLKDRAHLAMSNRIKISIIVVIAVCFIVSNCIIKAQKYDKYGDYSSSSSEFLATEDLYDVLTECGPGEYTISFEAKSDIEGVLRISLYEPGGGPFWFTTQKITTTTEFQEYVLHVNIAQIEGNVQHSHLTFQGTYRSGVIPYVRNVHIVKD